jgi:hypothetical protein
MRRLLVAACLVAVVAGCTTTGKSAKDGPSVAPSVTTVQVANSARFSVQSLRLDFVLADSFQSTDKPDYAFFARSNSPRALLTIDNDSPSVTDHQARPGETLSKLDIKGVKAVVVTNAALNDLPSGISANELLVSNGDRSFSVIMSGDSDAVPKFWETFVTSITIAAKG